MKEYIDFFIITKETLHCSDFFLMKTNKTRTAIASFLTKEERGILKMFVIKASLDHVFSQYYLLTITSESYDLSYN